MKGLTMGRRVSAFVLAAFFLATGLGGCSSGTSSEPTVEDQLPVAAGVVLEEVVLGKELGVRDARQQALAARAAAESARRSALETAADTLYPEQFLELESRLTLAWGALEEGQIVHGSKE